METKNASTSLITREYQMPSSFQIIGITMMHTKGRTRDRIKEIAADTPPSLSAVKKLDV